MASLQAERINGAGEITGGATLNVDRDEGYVYLKLGMIRVRVSLSRWRAMAAEVNLP